MNPGCEKTVSGHLNTIDRFSYLPDFIVHHIISFLDTREAYRTSILSKRWAHFSATNPILEFHYYCKKENSSARLWPSQEVSARLLGYIDTRMQRYDKDSLCIRALRLRFPNTCDVKELSCKVDEWLRIAVRNQVAELDLDVPINYQLPDILLSAKYLKRLECRYIKIPYYNKAINLASLQTFVLSYVVVEEHMLNHIISSCLLLKCLSVKSCSGFKTIVIPCCSQLKELTLSVDLRKDGAIILETSSLTCFKFTDENLLDFDVCWPVVSKPGSLRNLTTIDICSSGITDTDLGKLLPELVSLETLRLSNCHRLRKIRISSNQLKNIYVIHCNHLVKVGIDAPSLTKFQYNGDISLRAIAVSSQASCVFSVHTIPVFLDTQGFFKLKKFFT